MIIQLAKRAIEQHKFTMQYNTTVKHSTFICATSGKQNHSCRRQKS